MQKQYVGYYRLSLLKRDGTGYGLDAQQHAVAQYLTSTKGKLVAEFKEIESGRRKDRPELNKAINHCRNTGATLVIGKLDRLARNAAFVLNLRDSGVDFVALDCPHANKLTITILAAVAEQEATWISERTKAGLAAAKRRGVRLGTPMTPRARRKAIATNRRKATEFASKLQPVLVEVAQAGITTLRATAEALNRRGYLTPLGKAWTRQAVAKLKRRLR